MKHLINWVLLIAFCIGTTWAINIWATIFIGMGIIYVERRVNQLHDEVDNTKE